MPAEKRVPAAAAVVGPAGKETLGWRPPPVVRTAGQCSFPGTHSDRDHTAFGSVAEKAAAVNCPTLVAAAADVEAVVAAFVAAELVSELVAVVACAAAVAVLTWSCQTE